MAKELTPTEKRKVEEAAKLFYEVRDRYQQASERAQMSVLLTGETGTGKTFSVRTAPGPVLIDSFDPGGSRGLRDWVEKGHILVDDRYETEDPTRPTAWSDWQANFFKRFNSGFFNHIGTYVLDSVTMWSQACMNQVLKDNGRSPAVGASMKLKGGAAGVPQQSDYMMQMQFMAQHLGLIAGLPCNVIVIAHLDADVHRDDKGNTRIIKYRPLITGKMAVRIPRLFDEVYISEAVETSKGIEYKWLTQSTGLYEARSRLCADGKLDKREPQDWKALMKKVGLDPSDIKPQLEV